MVRTFVADAVEVGAVEKRIQGSESENYTRLVCVGHLLHVPDSPLEQCVTNYSTNKQILKRLIRFQGTALDSLRSCTCICLSSRGSDLDERLDSTHRATNNTKAL